MTYYADISLDELDRMADELQQFAESIRAGVKPMRDKKKTAISLRGKTAMGDTMDRLRTFASTVHAQGMVQSLKKDKPVAEVAKKK